MHENKHVNVEEHYANEQRQKLPHIVLRGDRQAGNWEAAAVRPLV